eukprot:TRINITY_DN7219_c0_g1_i1.p1 TRINITY_DN7219_c0_g1~~TRINITY_DN7219_c0_g1_i1.p1  ORF type:complete len:229 (-),score=19.11 TRINITY_DN7219_c0_g1_i1:116-802(-)
MNVRLASPKQFAVIIETLHSMLETITLDFGSDGLSVVSMDPAHIFVAELTLYKTAFAFYLCPTPLSISLNLKPLHNVLRHIKKDDMLTLWAEDLADGSLNISIRQPQTPFKENVYKIREINIITHERISMVDRSYPCEILLPTPSLTKICTELANMGDKIEIIVSPNKVIFDASDEFVSCKSCIVVDEHKQMAIHCLEEKCSQIFRFDCKFNFLFFVFQLTICSTQIF